MKETVSDIINKYVAERIESSGKLIDELVDRIHMKEELQSTINEAKARVYDAILELYKKTGLVITDVKMNYDQDGVNHWFNTWMVDFKIDRA